MLKKMNRLIINRSVFLSLLVITLLFSACNGNASPQQNNISPMAASSTVGAVTETAAETAVPTATPTNTEIPYPFYRGTPAPTPVDTLTTANDSNLTEIAHWGKGTINELEYSSDQSQIAVASSTGVFIYDAENLQEKAYLNFEGLMASRLIFSPDGQNLAVKFSEGTIAIYSLTAQKWTPPLVIGDGVSFSSTVGENFAFSSDGKSLLITKSGVLEIFDCSTGESLRRESLTGAETWTPLLITPDGKRLILIARESIQVINAVDYSQIAAVPAEDVNSYSLSKDGQFLAVEKKANSSYREKEVLVISTDTGEVVSRINKARFGISDNGDYFRVNVLISPDSKKLAVSYQPGPVCLWSMEKKSSLGCVEKTDRYNRSQIAFSEDSEVLLTSKNQTVTRWSTKDVSTIKEINTGDSGTINYLLSGKDNSIVLALDFVGESGQETAISQYSEKQKVELTFQSKEPVRDILFSNDGSLIITVEETAVNLRNAKNGQLQKSLPVEASLAKSSVNGAMLAVAKTDKSVQLYSLPEDKESFNLKGHSNPVTGLYFLPGKNILVTTAIDETYIWDIATGNSLFFLPDRDTVLQVLPTNDGFATVNQSMILKLWDLQTRAMTTSIESLKGSAKDALTSNYAGTNLAVLTAAEIDFIDLSAMAVRLSVPIEGLNPLRLGMTNNGSHMVIAVQDGLRVYEGANGTLVNTIPGKVDVFNVSPNDGHLVSASGSTIQIWTQIGNLPTASVTDYSVYGHSRYLAYISDTQSKFFGSSIQKAASSIVVTGSSGYQIMVDPQNGSRLITAKPDYSNLVYAFSPDARFMGIGGQDNNNQPVIGIKSMKDQSEISRTLTPSRQTSNTSTENLESLSLSNTGMTAAAIGDEDDSFVDIWDDQSLKPVSTVPGFRAAISADGKLLAVVEKKNEHQNQVIYDLAEPASPKILINVSMPGDSRVVARSIAFSPDGTQVALGDSYGNISLINPQTGHATASIERHNGEVIGLVYSSDGRQLYSITPDGTIWVWGIKPVAAPQPTSTPTNEPAAESTGVPANQPQVSGLVNPKAELPVLSAQNIEQLKLSGEWRLEENNEGYCKSCPRSISPVLVGSSLFPGQGPDTLLLFGMDSLSLFNPYKDNVPKVQEKWNFKLNYGILEPEGYFIIANDYKNPQIRVMTDFDGEQPSKMTHSIEPLGSMYVFTPDGQFMISLAMNYEIKKSELTVWNAQQDYKQAARIIFDKEILSNLAARSLPDGSYRVFLGRKVFNLTVDGRLQESKENADSPMRSFAPIALTISPDGNFLAAMNYENELKVFDTNTEAEMTFLQMEFDRTVDENDWPHCTAMVFLPGSKGILTAHTDGILRVWGAGNEMLAKVVITPVPVPTAYPLQSKEEMAAIENLASITPDNAGKLAEIKVWDADVCKLEENKNCTSWLTQVAGQSQILPENVDRDVYILSSSFKKLLVNPFSNPPVQLYKPEKDFFYSRIAVSQDGKMVVDLSGIGKTVPLYADTGKVLFELKGHELDYISDAAFSPDGRFLVTGFGDADKPAEIFVWDTKTGELVGKLKEKGYLSKLRFIPTMENDSYTLLGGYLFDISLPDSFRTYAISKDGKIQLRNKSRITDQGIDSLIVSPDGTLIGVGESNGFIKILSADGKKKYAQIDTKAENRTTGAVFLSSGKGILVARGDGTIALFGVKD